MAVAAALGLFQLSDPSLWIDEAFTARAVSDDAPSLTRELHVPYYIAMNAWAALAGTSELALRLPSVIGFVSAVILLHGLARHLYGHHIAFLSALLFAVNPFMVQWAQQARSYTLLVCLAIGSTWLLVRLLERPTRARQAAYVSAAVGMIFVQFLSALLLLAAHLVVARRSVRSRQAIGVAVLISTPWIAHLLRLGDPNGVGTPLPLDWLERPSPSDVWAAFTTVPGALGVGLAVALVGVLRAGSYRLALVAWAFVPFALSLLLSLVQPAFLDRYLIVTSPAFAILGALALVYATRWFRVATTVAVVGATVVALALFYSPPPGENWFGANWRAATKEAMRQGGADVQPDWASPAFVYYGGREVNNGWVLAQRPAQPGDRLHAEFGSWLRLLRPHSGQESPLPTAPTP